MRFPLSGSLQIKGISRERRGLLVALNECSKREGKVAEVVGGKGIDSQDGFKPVDQDGEAKRVQAGVEESQIVCERGKLPAVIPGHLNELIDDLFAHVYVETCLPFKSKPTVRRGERRA